MTEQGGSASPHIRIIPAALEQAPILANLLELYAYNFRAFPI